MFLRLASSISAFGVCCALITGCSNSNTSKLPPLPTDLDSPVAKLAQSASTDVGTVDHAFKGGDGAAVIMLEEFHNSRASQIQHAITLVRLYEQNKVRSIGLEGYLKERPRIDGAWFTRKWPNQTRMQNARVAVRLLKEGEISEAEFMKLVYDDLDLYPIETSSQYKVALSGKALDTMLDLAERIDPSRAKEIQKELSDAESQGQSISAEEHLSIAEDLERQRISKGIELPLDRKADWQSWLDFWRGRAGGNQTMLTAMTSVLQKSSVPAPMVVGAAHTLGLGNLLVSAGRPFAVVTPLALKRNDKSGDIDKNYNLKDGGLSVEPDGLLMKTIAGAVPSGAKKPEPVIFPVPWLEAKARIYQFTDRIANSILGPPNPPGGGGPPFGFNDDDFRTPLVQVDPRLIVYLPDDQGRKTVVFPVVLNPNDRKRRTTLWVKAGIGAVQREDGAAVEKLLKDALSEVQREKDAPSQAENDQGEIKPSSNTGAFVSIDRQEVTRHVLSAS